MLFPSCEAAAGERGTMRAVGERTSYLVGNLLGLSIWPWRATVRLESRNHEVVGQPCVLAFWHGRLMGVVMDNLGCRAVSMASLSSDGAVAAGALNAVGLQSARGSSSAGGREALREVERIMAESAPFAGLTVDGPKGPWRQVKPGVVLLARRLGVPLVPASFSCRRPKLLSSWDRMVLPKPFTRVVVAYGEPWGPERLAGPSREVVVGVAQALDALGDRLDRELVGRPLWPPL
jgi:lysophospholipid acyltransferase (LPLAT)-like uncharacterized protein